MVGFFKNKNVKSRSLFIKPYSDNYLYGKYENGVRQGQDWICKTVFDDPFYPDIACINFMNLSTASIGKNKEWE